MCFLSICVPFRDWPMHFTFVWPILLVESRLLPCHECFIQYSLERLENASFGPKLAIRFYMFFLSLIKVYLCYNKLDCAPSLSLHIEFINFQREYVKHTNWVCPVHYAMHSAACVTVNSRWISGRDEYFVILYSWKQCTQAITHGFKSIPVTWEWFPVCPHHNRSGKISLVTALLHVCIKIVKKLQWPGWFE